MENKGKSIKAFFCSGVGKLVMVSVFYLLFLGVFLLIANFMNTFFAVVYVAIFLYYGWKALNSIQPDMFLIMPIGGWVLYYLIKGIIALIIGMFVAPLAIANKIADYIQADIADNNG